MKIKLKKKSNISNIGYDGLPISNKEYIGRKKNTIMEQLMRAEGKNETKEEKVLRILKGDFETMFGMSFDEFHEIYREILENNPEKLI